MRKLQNLLISALAFILVSCPSPELKPPNIQSFGATPNALPFGGGQSVLSWQVTGADSVSIDQGLGVVTGSTTNITVNTTTTYTLSATNSVGTSSKSVTIVVAEPPIKQIVGKLNPWTRGARILKAKISNNATVEGTLEQNGDISLTLPDRLPNTASIFNAPTECSSSLALTPTMTKGATATFDIVTSTGIVSGSLFRANSNIFNGSLAQGTKQIQYVYVDRQSSWQGSCQQNGLTTSINATFEQGWNLFVLETINSTNRTIYTSSTPVGTNWRFIPSGTIQINNQYSDLEFGETGVLTAVANDGFELGVTDIDWVSENPLIVEIDASGKISAKNVGSSQITARYKDMPSISANTTVSVDRLIAQGSTLNDEDQSLGTAFRVQYQGVIGGAGPDIPMKILGPAGWNNNQPFETTVKGHLPGSWRVIETAIPPVIGTYTIRRSNRTQGGQTFTIASLDKLHVAKNLALYNSYSNAPSVRWEAPVLNPASSYDYFTEIIDLTTGAIVRPKQSTSTLTSAEFSDTQFDKTHTYKIRVYLQSEAFSSNEPFLGISVTSIILDFRPLIEKMETRGGLTSGGNSVVIQGANFDLNSKVFFGTTQVTSLSLNTTNTLLTVVAPSNVAGIVDITVQNSRGTSITSDVSKYTYFKVQEFTANFPQKLIKGPNGIVYFIESGTSQNSFNVQLSRINTLGSIVRLNLPSQDSSDVKDLTVDTTGNVWVAFSSKLVKVTPSSVITEFNLPSGVKAVALAIGSDGNIWILRSDSYKISRIQPDGSGATEFSMPQSNFGSGSFSGNNKIVLASDGNLWFTHNNWDLGRIQPNGAITVIANVAPGISAIISYDNAIWLTGMGILRVTLDGSVTTIGTCDGLGLAVGNDGYFWCGQSFATNGAMLNRRLISTIPSRVPTQRIAIATGNAQIGNVINDSNGNIWYIIDGKIGVVTL